MSGIREYLLRLCIGGICCTAALQLSGAGAKREITRFACTCIMLLLCLSGIKEIDFTGFDVIDKQDLQSVVDSSLRDQAESQLRQVDASLAGYIQEQASALGCACRVEIQSEAVEGEYQLQMITVITEDGAAHPALQSWMVAALNIRETQIRWEDE